MPETSVSQIHVPIKRLPGHAHATVPAYASADAAGMDLCAANDEPIAIPPGAVRLIGCGFAMAVPIGYEAQIRPRSGLAAKHAISMPNAPGTIDADYRGEVKVPLINHGPDPFEVSPGMRIAQMIIKPVPRAVWQEVDELPATERGDGGFGHTGV